MRVVVLVKHVPDPTASRYGPDLTVDRSDSHLCELDEYAVEQAVSLAEGATGATVTCLTMGPPRAADALRKALAMGCDDAVHLTDEALHGSDALATSFVLARAIERIGFDLVVTGMASTDGEMSVVPAMLAERLGVPQMTFAGALSVADGSVTIRRDDEAAAQEVVADLPAVVSVTDRTGEPRYPAFKAIMVAKKKPVTTWSLADLGVEPVTVGTAGAATAVRSVVARPPRQGGQVVVDEGDGARRIADFLVAHKLL